MNIHYWLIILLIIYIITFSGLKECDGEAVDAVTALATVPAVFISLSWGAVVGLVELDGTIKNYEED